MISQKRSCIILDTISDHEFQLWLCFAKNFRAKACISLDDLSQWLVATTTTNAFSRQCLCGQCKERKLRRNGLPLVHGLTRIMTSVKTYLTVLAVALSQNFPHRNAGSTRWVESLQGVCRSLSQSNYCEHGTFPINVSSHVVMTTNRVSDLLQRHITSLLSKLLLIGYQDLKLSYILQILLRCRFCG